MLLKRLLGLAFGESIYKNSSYLLLSSTVLAILGFVFWAISARIFSPYQVGVATALLAALNLITSLSLLGFEVSIIRILPDHPAKSSVVNSVLTIASIIGILISLGFIVFQPHIAGSLWIIRKNNWYSMVFVLFTLISVVSYITESVFVAYRKTVFILWKNLIFSVAKILLIFVFASLGPFGLYSAWMIGLGLAVVYSLISIQRFFGHKLKLSVSYQPLRGAIKYSASNYVTAFIEGLPVMIVPLIATSIFGPSENAYYYIAMTIATFLYTISIAATQSLFAEGSHKSGETALIAVKSLKYILVLTIPCIVGIVIFGRYFLLIFGTGYSQHAALLLDILAISALPIGINTIARTVLRVTYNMKGLLLVDVAGTLPIIALIYPMRGLGDLALGYSWLFGQLFTLVLFSFLYYRELSYLIAKTFLYKSVRREA